MKKLTKLFLAVLVLFVAFAFVGCDGEKQPEGPTDEEIAAQLVAAKTAAKAEFASLVASVNRDAYEAEDLDDFDLIIAYANKFFDDATTVASVNDALKVSKEQFNARVKLAKKYATGVYSFVASSYAERTEILGILEAYAYEHFSEMRYVEFMGSKWKIEAITVERPRLILSIGGLYNGEK